ncbi:MAG: diguanylate cyclase [Rubrivivax sp.]|jgi:diguanylate cyclase (GGDEF)-like protein
MTHAQIVLILILLQQSLAAGAWLLASSFLRVSPRPIRHWAAASGLVAGGLVLYASTGQVPTVLTHDVANVLITLSFIVLRRGLQVFLRLPATDRQHLTLAGLTVGLALWGWALESGAAESSLLSILVATAGPAGCLAALVHEARGPLRREFGRRPAMVVLAVWCLVAVAFMARFVAALLWPAQAAQPVGVDTLFNTVLVMALMVGGLALHLMLALLVILRLALKLRHLSRHDVLTGLPNRRLMQEEIAAAWSRHARHGEPCALLAVDIDHFKRVNDRHGHGVGDDALVHVGRTLREALRSDDCVARMGGEEFCVLLRSCSAGEAERQAERLRAAVAGAPLQLADGQSLTLTVSIGVAMAPGAAEPELLMAQADGALYAAKHAGRDRVVLHAPA